MVDNKGNNNQKSIPNNGSGSEHRAGKDVPSPNYVPKTAPPKQPSKK